MLSWLPSGHSYADYDVLGDSLRLGYVRCAWTKTLLRQAYKVYKEDIPGSL
jgi:hypothetical protein